MRSAERSSARVFASSGVPRSVRSPQSSSTSATSFTCLTKFRNRPCWSSRQWRSPDAATRTFVFGSRATGHSSLLFVSLATAGVPPAVDVEAVVDPGHQILPADPLLLRPGLERLHHPREQAGHHPVGNDVAVARVREAEEHELREEDLPVAIEPLQYAVPVEPRPH